MDQTEHLMAISEHAAWIFSPTGTVVTRVALTYFEGSITSITISPTLEDPNADDV